MRRSRRLGGRAAFYADDRWSHSFDIICTAFRTTSQTKLSQSLGVCVNASGRLFVSEHQEAAENAIYAAGDLVCGLNQIAVAANEATQMRSALDSEGLATTPQGRPWAGGLAMIPGECPASQAG